MYGNNLVNIRETKLLCASSSNLADMHVNHGERINPFDFGGHRSKFRVTMNIYRNKLLSMIETKCASSSNLADMLTIERGRMLLKVRFTIGIIDNCGVRGDATLCVVIFKNILDFTR